MTKALGNIVVVLDEPQDLVNIASVVRAMMNMGLWHLRLVEPAEFDAYRIAGIAHRSEALLDRARLYRTLSDAIGDASVVVGTTARPRTAQRNYDRPREAAAGIVEQARKGIVAIVLGREDRGLSNEALDRCHKLLMIPTHQEYSSMNLAQALLIVAYEVFLAAQDTPPSLPVGRRTRGVATVEELEETYRVLEEGLGRIDFFKARRPVSVMRTLRTLLARAQPDRREARLVRAIGYEIGHYLDRTRGERRP